MIRVQVMLCAIDLSTCSRRALEFADALARWAKARLVVLNVGETVSLWDRASVQLDDILAGTVTPVLVVQGTLPPRWQTTRS